MAAINSRAVPTLLALAVITSLLGAPTSRAHSPGVDAAAVNILKRMTNYVSKLQQFSVRTDNTLEEFLDSGQRVDLSVAAQVLIRRPNKLRAERLGDRVSQEFYYDGETLTLYNPSDAMYATLPAPGTVEELLDFARESLGLIIPASDLVYRNAFVAMMQDVTSAVVIGKTMIGGTMCDHLAFRRPGVDFQLWIADGDQPLPCKYVITDTSDPAYVSTTTVMSDWNLDPAPRDDAFSFQAPDGARSITFMRLDDAGSLGR